MKFSGTQTVTVPIEKVWAYLADIDKVAACGPGFQSLEKLGPEHWKALVAIGIGLIRAKFIMDVKRTVLQKPDLIVVQVYGKAPGSAMELEGRMQLIAVDEEQTSMNWSAQVTVSGVLASIGAHLINSKAEKLTRQFFACLKSRLQASEVPSASLHREKHE
jgi:carbon monoxide dehydrogenase subunit G